MKVLCRSRLQRRNVPRSCHALQMFTQRRRGFYRCLATMRVFRRRNQDFNHASTNSGQYYLSSPFPLSLSSPHPLTSPPSYHLFPCFIVCLPTRVNPVRGSGVGGSERSPVKTCLLMMFCEVKTTHLTTNFDRLLRQLIRICTENSRYENGRSVR